MRLTKQTALVIVTFALMQALQTTHAQPTPPAADNPALIRPKIALVLSGGGARGAAHIGVIKVL
ncbi:MAG: hypothetical protein ACKO15_12760 [Burkholderiales bacterium]